MRLSMPLGYIGGLTEAADKAVAFEKVGLDIAWTAEAYGFDGVSLMGYLAARTERLLIGSAILPLYTRTPTLLAMTAAGVDALSDGRCILGLGASGPQVIEGWHGVRYDKPLGRTREIIGICRKAWAREAHLVNDGAIYPLPLPDELGSGFARPLKMRERPVRARIPIYLAALGTKNVELAAELADGWLPLFFLPEKAKEIFGPSLREGATRRAADLDPLEICAGGVAAIGEPAETNDVLDRVARPRAAMYIGGMGAKGKNFYNTLVSRYGYEREAAEIQDLYLAGKRDEAAAKVPARLLELTNLCGTASFVKERIAAYKEAGVTVLDVSPVGPNGAKVVELLKEWSV